MVRVLQTRSLRWPEVNGLTGSWSLWLQEHDKTCHPEICRNMQKSRRIRSRIRKFEDLSEGSEGLLPATKISICTGPKVRDSEMQGIRVDSDGLCQAASAHQKINKSTNPSIHQFPGAVHLPCFSLFSSRISKIQQRLGPQVRGPQLLQVPGTSLISMDCTKDLQIRLADKTD